MGDNDLIPAWATVIELASVDALKDWTLVGGLMVYVHAGRSGIHETRPTKDADFLVNYVGDPSSLVRARAELAKLGFELQTDQATAYRYQHADGRQIDVMVADHLPTKMKPPRLSQRPAFEAPAGSQAIYRSDTYVLRFPTGDIEVRVPDELGALVSKGAAYLADQRDRNRHLSDAAVLFASVGDLGALDYSTISTNDRKRVRAVYEQLNDPQHPAWANLQPDEQVRGMQNMQFICARMQI